jgi:membrane-associated two-gene conflict system component 1 (EACC1)
LSMAESGIEESREEQTPRPPSGGPLLLNIEALSDRYDQSDDRWLDQVADLIDRLHEDVGGVQRGGAPPTAGQKGTAEALILALGSAGAFQAAVACFRAWLTRDRSRRLRLVITNAEGPPYTVEIAGDTIDSRTFHDVAELMARRLPMR